MKRKHESTVRPMTFAAMVQTQRRKLGKRLEALAAESGLSLSTIRRVEDGAMVPHRATVIALASALKLDAVDLEKLTGRAS